MEELCVASIALVAVIVYTPAACGAVSVTFVPLELVVELKDPPAGVTLQVTPVESLVVAVRLSCWPAARPARPGEIAMEIVPGLIVRENVAAAVCALELESVTWKVSES
jgi:hypothetical protein